MRVMGIERWFRARHQQAAPGHRIYPYLLRAREHHRAQSCLGQRHHLYSDGAWLLYLVAIIDWSSPGGSGVALFEYDGYGFCIVALDEALARTARPKISTPIRARSSTSAPSPAARGCGIAISMDGRGRFMTTFIERLWRSIKIVGSASKAYADGASANGSDHDEFLQSSPPASGDEQPVSHAAWRAGIDRIEAAKTVDMPLRWTTQRVAHTTADANQQQEAA